MSVAEICNPWSIEAPPSTQWDVHRLATVWRITEDGLLRVTEGELRIIEQCVDASPPLDTTRTTEDGATRLIESGSIRTTE